ncbi:hypothetical protein EYF80_057695 [Liparis tanakae]|uniref:Uncharacterized protein n=1 Tax=Liparis tanakae TaxID=230148 RepID=A0A4Z2ET97_9TELE|nr:hypothetical protein EYF80_057695 [Liparis tanakae]
MWVTAAAPENRPDGVELKGLPQPPAPPSPAGGGRGVDSPRERREEEENILFLLDDDFFVGVLPPAGQQGATLPSPPSVSVKRDVDLRNVPTMFSLLHLHPLSSSSSELFLLSALPPLRSSSSQLFVLPSQTLVTVGDNDKDLFLRRGTFFEKRTPSAGNRSFAKSRPLEGRMANHGSAPSDPSPVSWFQIMFHFQDDLADLELVVVQCCTIVSEKEMSKFLK